MPSLISSAIYRGKVRHRRFIPRERNFEHSVCYFYLDLDEVPRLFNRRFLFSTHSPSLFGFRRKAYLGNPKHDLREEVRDRVEKAIGIRPSGSIRVLTQISYLGFSFNPVSFYYCYQDQMLVAIVSEITNTPWSERHAYVHDCRNSEREFNFEKEFHVSPFLAMEYDYRWKFTDPAKALVIHMENRAERLSSDSKDTKRSKLDPVTFEATLTLRRLEWTGNELFWALLSQPFMTWKTHILIYGHAAILWLRRFPVYTHPGALRVIPTKKVKHPL